MHRYYFQVPLLLSSYFSLSLRVDHRIPQTNGQVAFVSMSMCIRFSILPRSEWCIPLAVTYSVLLSSSHSVFFFYFLFFPSHFLSPPLPSNSRGNRPSMLFLLSLSPFLFFFLSFPTFFTRLLPVKCRLQLSASSCVGLDHACDTRKDISEFWPQMASPNLSRLWHFLSFTLLLSRRNWPGFSEQSEFESSSLTSQRN